MQLSNIVAKLLRRVRYRSHIPRWVNVPNDQLPKQLDLQSLPVRDAIRWLQTLADQIVIPLIEDPNTNADRISPLFDTNGSYRHLFSDDVIRKENPLSTQVTRTIRSKNTTLDNWQSLTIYEIERRLGLYIHGFNIPASLWILLSIHAWENPTAVERMGKRIEMFLNQRMFYTRGEIPTIRFHRNTIWLLIAGYPLEQKMRWRLRDASPHKYLQSSIPDFVMEDRYWAGYADQWILLRAYQQWKDNHNWTGATKRQIEKLPLYKQAIDIHPWVQTNWRTSMPHWIINLDIDTAAQSERLRDESTA